MSSGADWPKLNGAQGDDLYDDDDDDAMELMAVTTGDVSDFRILRDKYLLTFSEP